MTPSGQAFAVGNSGTILFYDGSAWSVMTSGTSNNLRAVWGRSATDVYAGGWMGTLLHYDGTSWSPVDAGFGSTPIYSIWGTASETFVGGMYGKLARNRGSGFVDEFSGSDGTIYDLWGATSDELYTTSYRHRLLRRCAPW